jgi:hypothetical protein
MPTEFDSRIVEGIKAKAIADAKDQKTIEEAQRIAEPKWERVNRDLLRAIDQEIKATAMLENHSWDQFVTSLQMTYHAVVARYDEVLRARATGVTAAERDFLIQLRAREAVEVEWRRYPTRITQPAYSQRHGVDERPIEARMPTEVLRQSHTFRVQIQARLLRAAICVILENSDSSEGLRVDCQGSGDSRIEKALWPTPHQRSGAMSKPKSEEFKARNELNVAVREAVSIVSPQNADLLKAFQRDEVDAMITGGHPDAFAAAAVTRYSSVMQPPDGWWMQQVDLAFDEALKRGGANATEQLDLIACFEDKYPSLLSQSQFYKANRRRIWNLKRRERRELITPKPTPQRKKREPRRALTARGKIMKSEIEKQGYSGVKQFAKSMQVSAGAVYAMIREEKGRYGEDNLTKALRKLKIEKKWRAAPGNQPA